jgi:pimeloyl-ACP methyl ester carboxylesterase
MLAIQKNQLERVIMPIEKRMVNDVEIACWMNSGEWVTDRKTLVFIHGSGGDHTSWVYQYGQLKNDFNIAVMELPGHGGSGGKGEQDVEKYAQWVRAALPVFGVSMPVIVGHSLGAAIALTFAIKYGELIKGIVVFGGGVKMPVNPLILEGIKKDPAAVLAMTAKIAVAKKNRERLAKILAQRKPNPDVLYGDFLACDRLDIAEAIKKIKLPTLIICGLEDKMTPPVNSESLRDSIPGAQLALIAEAGHMVMMEDPEAFNKVLKTFVDSLA